MLADYPALAFMAKLLHDGRAADLSSKAGCHRLLANRDCISAWNEASSTGCSRVHADTLEGPT